jgi:hypothetical protein
MKNDKQHRLGGALVFVLLAAFALGCAEPAIAQRVAFEGVRIRFNTSERKQVESSASLIFDDSSRKVLVESGQKPVQINYDDVAQVIFDWRLHIHRRGLAKEFGLGALTDAVGRVSEPVGRTVENRLDATAINELTDRTMMIQTNTRGSMPPFEVEIGIDDANRVLAKAKQVFDKKVYVPDVQIGFEIDKKTLKDAGTKHTVTISKNHPEPQIRPDKALIVVVCPRANIPGSSGWQMKLHANDSVVAVNRPGTYSFAYVDPGEYLLASQAGFAGGNANAFKMKLDAGRDYYFLQNITTANRTVLTGNPKPIVLLEIGGSAFSEWKRKP